ncbi:hypothetical protein H2198_004507 [Neophaeococcomyces mojaviensis]|uniref:Uncharacterized protein n=1 Tax=Neophaeococcomyces mojaviensis TaxID=3383035 RepID=A0ACC3A8T8_9EURO|nr:hypothetical protein H2198_004507 [Knufia sp. JES_112]
MDNRRGLSKSENAATPVTPPARYVSSNLSTPGSTFGKEEDAVIFELTPRYIKAGIEGESHAQCRVAFTPDASRRHGDYRTWLPGYHRANEGPESLWGEAYELWRNDLKDVDLGLLSNKLERVVREIYNTRLLVDAGNARLVLVIQSLIPHPVLSTVLQTLFERWSFPSITLLPAPATAIVSAGLRSGLVIDVGWEETVVTAVYEFREVRCLRTTRATKLVTQNVAKWAQSILDAHHRLDLNLVEELIRRVGLHVLQQAAEETSHGASSDKDRITLDWPTTNFTKPISFNHADVFRVIHESLLDPEGDGCHDDEELPLHKLVHDCLLALPLDIRGICISRLVFIGEGSDMPSVPTTILRSLNELIKAQGWTEVLGQKVRKRREGLTELAQTRAQPVDARHDDVMLAETLLTEERYIRDKMKHLQPPIQSVVRQVDSLGSWAGASLLTTLKVKSFVEIQRERFLSHGLSGASRSVEVSSVQPRMSTLGLRSKPAERTSWTLSGWA